MGGRGKIKMKNKIKYKNVGRGKIKRKNKINYKKMKKWI